MKSLDSSVVGVIVGIDCVDCVDVDVVKFDIFRKGGFWTLILREVHSPSSPLDGFLGKFSTQF